MRTGDIDLIALLMAIYSIAVSIFTLNAIFMLDMIRD